MGAARLLHKSICECSTYDRHCSSESIAIEADAITKVPSQRASIRRDALITHAICMSHAAYMANRGYIHVGRFSTEMRYRRNSSVIWLRVSILGL